MDPQAAAQQHYQQQLPQHQYPQQGWVMQQQPGMWGQPPQAVAPSQQQYRQPAPDSAQPTNAEDVRTLWIGDLQYWMDENYLTTCFPQTGEILSIKVIRNKQTQQSECYGFIEFSTRAAAERILQTYNGAMMPNVEQSFKLNWAYYGAGEKHDEGADYTIFVGDLAADVTDFVLQETFRPRYQSIKGAKVVIDRLTGRTKGYGFVRFGDESEQLRAMQEMNGVPCSTRPMRIGPAANRKTGNGSGSASYQSNQVTQGDSDPNNTTVFVGNLDTTVVTDDHLRQIFSPYGELSHVKIIVGKRCGFVQFVNRSSAEEAIRILNGTQLAGQNIRLSWGRSPSNKQDPGVGAAQPQWNAPGYYGYAQDLNMYSYAAQDPNMYYQGYPGYGNYPMQQQQQQQQQQPVQQHQVRLLL
ncbi:hypothetical protein V2J09_006363 [Rumex salicifolius]